MPSSEIKGNIILDTEMMMELVGNTVAEMIYESVWREGEIVGWSFDVPELEVHYSVDVEFDDED